MDGKKQQIDVCTDGGKLGSTVYSGLPDILDLLVQSGKY